MQFIYNNYIIINKKLIIVPIKRIAEKDRFVSTPTSTTISDSRYLFNNNLNNNEVIFKENIEEKSNINNIENLNRVHREVQGK